MTKINKKEAEIGPFLKKTLGTVLTQYQSCKSSESFESAVEA